MNQSKLLELTSEIVAAHVTNNNVASNDLSAAITTVFGTLTRLNPGQGEVVVKAQTPAVPIAESVTDDFLVCLEDGKKFRVLKPYLSSEYNLTPDEYRAKWGLRHDYPMVAPEYSRQRRQLALKIRLGCKSAPMRKDVNTDRDSQADEWTPRPTQR